MEYEWLNILSSLLVLNTTYEHSWIQILLSCLVLNRNDLIDPIWLRICQKGLEILLRNIVIVGLYIALKFIEYQGIFE